MLGGQRIVTPYACLTDLQETEETVNLILEWEETYQAWYVTHDMDGTAWIMAEHDDISLNEWLWFRGAAKSKCWGW
jgi:hypothetical protein